MCILDKLNLILNYYYYIILYFVLTQDTPIIIIFLLITCKAKFPDEIGWLGLQTRYVQRKMLQAWYVQRKMLLVQFLSRSLLCQIFLSLYLNLILHQLYHSSLRLKANHPYKSDGTMVDLALISQVLRMIINISNICRGMHIPYFI